MPRLAMRLLEAARRMTRALNETEINSASQAAKIARLKATANNLVKKYNIPVMASVWPMLAP